MDLKNSFMVWYASNFKIHFITTFWFLLVRNLKIFLRHILRILLKDLIRLTLIWTLSRFLLLKLVLDECLRVWIDFLWSMIFMRKFLQTLFFIFLDACISLRCDVLKLRPSLIWYFHTLILVLSYGAALIRDF